ncbi:immunoglobulin kappa light chain-like [Ranitomeya imitator]|uniref:immunoglobulin kappa light chain-like n=1 Tax=Ranitomeya imitator TaxID=111125 RepID=UPI0037E76AB7
MKTLHLLLYTILVLLFHIVSCQELKSLIRPTGRTAKFTCGVDGISVLQQGLHWYHQDNSKVIKWLLFYKPGKPDEAVQEYKTRTSLEIVTESSCTLSITNIKPRDDGTYFCAAWHKDASMKKFGTGTKLLVIDQTAVKPDVTILATTKEVVKDIGFATLLCNLQNFFPDMINVMWTAEGSNVELESEQGELIKNSSSQTSSLYSWITIKKSDIGKIYKCRYKHEGNVAVRDLWQEVAYDTAILKDPSEDEPKNGNCTNSSGDVEASARITRAAQLIYMILFLKCFTYFPFLLVLKYKCAK